jgi:hypothetical protein
MEIERKFGNTEAGEKQKDNKITTKILQKHYMEWQGRTK